MTAEFLAQLSELEIKWLTEACIAMVGKPMSSLQAEFYEAVMDMERRRVS